MAKGKKGLNKTGNRNNGKTNNENAVTAPKQQAVAFMHWELLNKAGEVALKDDKGLAIFQNPKYQSDAEDRLIQLAGMQDDDVITVNARLTIRLNKKKNVAASADELLADLF
jgi:hypothetical protein